MHRKCFMCMHVPCLCKRRHAACSLMLKLAPVHISQSDLSSPVLSSLWDQGRQVSMPWAGRSLCSVVAMSLLWLPLTISLPACSPGLCLRSWAPLWHWFLAPEDSGMPPAHLLLSPVWLSFDIQVWSDSWLGCMGCRAHGFPELSLVLVFLGPCEFGIPAILVPVQECTWLLLSLPVLMWVRVS